MKDRWIGALQTHISGLNQDDVDFLTEALMNCEPEDWEDILSPFFDNNIEQQAARKAEILADLRKRAPESPGASGSGYAARESDSADNIVQVDPNLSNYLFGPIADLLQTKRLLSIADTFRLRATCKLAQRLDKRGLFWRPKAEHFCRLTGKAMEDVRDARKYFFSLVPSLPRFDGVYIGKCITLSTVREGSSMATFLKPEDKQSIVRGSYRRYLRMWPPEIGEDGKAEWPPRGRAMVMMDCGHKGNEAEHMMINANPVTHENDGDVNLTPENTPRVGHTPHQNEHASSSARPNSPRTLHSGKHDPAGKIDKEMLRKQMFSGWWQIHGEDLQGNILIKIQFVSTTTQNDSTMVMKMCHAEPSCSNLLKWREYTLVCGDYVDEVDLGLDSYGEVLPHQTCHYAPYRLKRSKELEHFL